jgi:YaiO family outer membrane protein
MNGQKPYTFIQALILVLVPSMGNADAVKLSDSPLPAKVSTVAAEDTYQKLKKLAQQEGQQQEAIAEAIVYLRDHPTDGDVRLLLGQLYFNNKEYIKAREELRQILQQTPNNMDASLVLINVEMVLNNNQAALDLVNSALLLNPSNTTLAKKKDDILAAIHTEKTPAKSDDEYKKLTALYTAGQCTEVIQQSAEYLSLHPDNGDVRLLLGKCYFENKDYTKARKELLVLLQQTPNDIDARLILINIEMVSKHYKKALALADEGLVIAPQDKNLVLKRKNIINTIRAKKKSISTSKETPRIEEKKYRNEIGIYQQQYYISDVRKIWDYSSLYYGRETPRGPVYGRVNYAQRFSKQAVQGELEAFPRINKYLVLDAVFGFGNDPNLFPNQTYALEAYVSMPKAFDFSLGGRFNNVDKNHYFTVYTGSLAKDFYNNRITFRPYYFVPGVGETSNLYTLNFRHMLVDPYFYFGVLIGAGTSPDLANLTTVNFIVVRNKIISPYINFPLLHERLIVNISFLYQNQVFPLQRVRNWSGGTLGLAWKF